MTVAIRRELHGEHNRNAQRVIWRKFISVTYTKNEWLFVLDSIQKDVCQMDTNNKSSFSSFPVISNVKESTEIHLVYHAIALLRIIWCSRYFLVYWYLYVQNVYLKNLMLSHPHHSATSLNGKRVGMNITIKISMETRTKVY